MRVIGPLLAVVLAGACAAGGPMRFDSPEALYERALEEYQDEDWTEAILLLERLKLEYPTFSRIQEARFQLGNAYFSKKEYVTAANEFVRLATDYPTGTYADDARFRVCEAYAALSPVVERDQEYTRGAIEHCESLVAFYPTSEYVPQAREIVREMTNKLAAKVYEGGQFYQQRNAFDSAILYYERVIEEYPNSDVAPRALLRLVEVYTRLGYAEEARGAKERLLKEYPDSPAAREVAAIPVADGT